MSSPRKPIITTDKIKLITQNSAVIAGEILSDGGLPILQRGICYSTSPNPTIDDYSISDDTELTAFASHLTDLINYTRYYARAYAINSQGVGYGEVKNFITFPFGIEMILVEGGTFEMGATPEQDSGFEDELPVHEVTLSDFYIAKYEVTQLQWNEIMGNNPSAFQVENFPVETVSWDDCQLFVNKLNQLTGKNYSLPTEAQWEYAARGGNKSKKTRYSGSNNYYEVAWIFQNTGLHPNEVGTKNPNELGIHDMTGNVSEWCQDWHGPYESGEQYNPTGPENGTSKIIRGGYFFTSYHFSNISLRSTLSPANKGVPWGLRIVMNP